MRRLALHASALSDLEYELYTESLKDIALSDDDGTSGATEAEDDVFYEKLTVSVREARAWLRGRYSHLPASIIDGILKFFSPSDVLSGTEFFAALRLVIHAENGKEPDRSLAFVQAQPGQRSRLADDSGSKQSMGPMHAPPSRRSNSTLKEPSKPRSSPPPRHPNESTPSRRPHPVSSIATSSSDFTSYNPFTSGNLSQPPVHPSQRPELTHSASSSSHNPFAPKPPRSEDGSKPPLPPRKPPPPVPHHSPGPSVPPRHTSSHPRPERSTSPSKLPNPAPVVPPKTSQHVTSTLIKQSLQASKVAQTMKKAEEQLEKERVMQVLKSSSVVSGTNIHQQQQHRGWVGYPPSSTSSGSDERAPPLPRRRLQQPSPPMSASSLEQVALAAPPSFPSRDVQGFYNRNPDSPFRTPPDSVAPLSESPDNHSPTRPAVDFPSGPPPTHPDRKPHLHYQSPSESRSEPDTNLESFEAVYGPSPSTSTITETSPNTRVFRSKSMHHVTPPLPPLPPPVRRKRPESIQVLSSANGALERSTSRQSSLSRNASLSSPGHRRSSLSTSSTPSSNQTSYSGSHGYESALSMSGIQRTIATLQPKLEAMQPKLDKARYKAEAGLSRRGFMRDPVRTKSGLEGQEEEGLMGEVTRGRGGFQEKSTWNGAQDLRRNGMDERELDDEWSTSQGMNTSGSPSSDLSPNVTGDRLQEDTLRVRHGDDRVSSEKDNLKWPPGDGWKPL